MCLSGATRFIRFTNLTENPRNNQPEYQVAGLIKLETNQSRYCRGKVHRTTVGRTKNGRRHRCFCRRLLSSRSTMVTKPARYRVPLIRQWVRRFGLLGQTGFSRTGRPSATVPAQHHKSRRSDGVPSPRSPGDSFLGCGFYWCANGFCT